MKDGRRKLLLLPGAALLAQAAPVWSADHYPTRPVRIVVGFSAGGPTDAVVRLLAQRLSVELGQPVMVENRPGAGSVVANESVARAPKDGYTLLFAGSSLTMGASFMKVRYDPVADFAPISQVLQLAFFLVVRADMQIRTLDGFVAYLKAHPGKVAYGSSGMGSLTHIQAELFQDATGTRMLHVPYPGQAAMAADLIGGRLQAAFDGYTTAAPQLRNGTLNALAVVLPTRSSALPAVPTMAQAGVQGQDAVGWSGLVAPAGTPRPVIDRLSAAVALTMQDPGVKAKLHDIGGEPSPSSPDAYAELIRRETAKWAALARRLELSAQVNATS